MNRMILSLLIATCTLTAGMHTVTDPVDDLKETGPDEHVIDMTNLEQPDPQHTTGGMDGESSFSSNSNESQRLPEQVIDMTKLKIKQELQPHQRAVRAARLKQAQEFEEKKQQDELDRQSLAKKQAIIPVNASETMRERISRANPAPSKETRRRVFGSPIDTKTAGNVTLEATLAGTFDKVREACPCCDTECCCCFWKCIDQSLAKIGGGCESEACHGKCNCFLAVVSGTCRLASCITCGITRNIAVCALSFPQNRANLKGAKCNFDPSKTETWEITKAFCKNIKCDLTCCCDYDYECHCCEDMGNCCVCYTGVTCKNCNKTGRCGCAKCTDCRAPIGCTSYKDDLTGKIVPVDDCNWLGKVIANTFKSCGAITQGLTCKCCGACDCFEQMIKVEIFQRGCMRRDGEPLSEEMEERLKRLDVDLEL